MHREDVIWLTVIGLAIALAVLSLVLHVYGVHL